MPSVEIQTTSVTCCRPASCRCGSRRCSRSRGPAPPPSRASANAPGITRCRRDAAEAARPARRKRRAARSGLKAGAWRGIGRSGLQEEVEADACHAEHEQRGVVAQEAVLHGAHRGRARAHDARWCRRSACPGRTPARRCPSQSAPPRPPGARSRSRSARRSTTCSRAAHTPASSAPAIAADVPGRATQMR